MEHANATTSLRQQLQQQQQQQQQHQQQQLQQHNQQQQQQNDSQQQFCLRWHNHQTSLLSTLPILLDQSHLTDVTLSAEGRTLRAHRVVLSACSTFFLELFRALDTSNHPVIIIPGASFAAIVALLTFMYSGEVNVYEEQIPTLLSLAETLGIKGLADVQNNLQKSAKRPPDLADQQQCKLDVDTPPTPLTPPDFLSQQQPHISTLLPPTLSSVPTATSGSKIPTPLESLFLKSLQFYPNLLPQPLNFSQSALNKTSELLAKYQQHCNLYQNAFSAGGISPIQQQLEEAAALSNEDAYNAKRLCTAEKRQQQHQQQQHQQQQQQKDIKRIDKIVENLRCSNKPTPASDSYILAAAQQQHQHQQQQQQAQQQLHPQLTLKTSISNFAQHIAPHITTKPPMFASATTQQQQQHSAAQHGGYMSPEDHTKLQQQLEHFASCNRDGAANRSSTPDGTGHKPETSLLAMTEKLSTNTPTPASPQPKTPSNSKLYATCFICHKQLSNQYNLRVHLETHQNVRYACNVCSHVSRSKDALRKHVSYRHPGAPSPCESEARRKRAKTINIATSTTSAVAASSSMAGGTPPSPTSAPTTPFQMSNLGGNNAVSGDAADTTTTTPTTPLSAAYMFLPNQFHIAAAAAAATAAAANVQQHMQQQQMQASSNNNNSNINTQIQTTAASTLPNTETTSLTNCSLASTNVVNTLTAASPIVTATPTSTTPTTENNNQNSSFTSIVVKSEPSPAENSGSLLTGASTAASTVDSAGSNGGSLSTQ